MNKIEERIYLTLRANLDEISLMSCRVSTIPFFDLSLAFIASVITAFCFGWAVNTLRTSDLSMSLIDDEVKVEAARFLTGPEGEMDIFTSGCESKTSQVCK